MRTSFRISVSPLLFSLLLAVGACGDSTDPATIDESGTQDASDSTDATDGSGSSNIDESPDSSEQAEAGSAADDPAEEDSEPAADEPAEDEPAEDEGQVISADPDLEAAISGWIVGNNVYTSQQSEGDCVAQGIVDGIGAERLVELDVTVATPSPFGLDLTDDEGEVLIDSLFGCIDMRQSFIDNIVGPDLSEEDANCVVDEMGRDFVLDGIRTGLLTPEDTDFDGYLKVVEEAGDACGVDMDG